MHSHDTPMQELFGHSAVTHDGHRISADRAVVHLFASYERAQVLSDKFRAASPAAEDDLMMVIGLFRTALLTVFPEDEVNRIDRIARVAAGWGGVGRVVESKRDAEASVDPNHPYYKWLKGMDEVINTMGNGVDSDEDQLREAYVDGLKRRYPEPLKLPPLERQALQMRFAQGGYMEPHSYKMISEGMGIPLERARHLCIIGLNRYYASEQGCTVSDDPATVEMFGFFAKCRRFGHIPIKVSAIKQAIINTQEE